MNERRDGNARGAGDIMSTTGIRTQILSAALLLAACGGGERATTMAGASVAAAGPETTPLREWRLPPDLYPFQIDAAAGRVFFLALEEAYPQGTFVLGQLDVATGSLAEWPVPSWMTSPADVLVRVNGSGVRAWLTDVQDGAIGVLDPETATYTEWRVGMARDLAPGPDGHVFFSTMDGVGRLDPAANVVTYWPMPGRRIEDVATDGAGRVLFTIMRWNEAAWFDGIGMLDPATGEVTEWATPCPYFGMGIDARGDAFFCTEKKAFARLSPATGVLTEWALGVEDLCGEFVDVGPGGAFASGHGIYQLDPAPPGAGTALPSATRVVAPATAAAVPAAAGLTPSTTAIAPAAATATGVRNGPVTRWSIDLPMAHTRGVSVDERGTVFYTDQGRRAIGALFEGQGEVPPPVEIAVRIDIHPGSAENCVNVNGSGVIPVAILTDAAFDAALVDPATVALEGMPVKTVGAGNRPLARLEDVDGDGDLDLLVQIADTGALLDPDQRIATLTGALRDGRPFRGTDEVCIVP